MKILLLGSFTPGTMCMIDKCKEKLEAERVSYKNLRNLEMRFEPMSAPMQINVLFFSL